MPSFSSNCKIEDNQLNGYRKDSIIYNFILTRKSLDKHLNSNCPLHSFQRQRTMCIFTAFHPFETGTTQSCFSMTFYNIHPPPTIKLKCNSNIQKFWWHFMPSRGGSISIGLLDAARDIVLAPGIEWALAQWPFYKVES